MKNADMPAIPCEFDHNKDANGVEQYTGLTKREHFAAMAMQALISNPQALIMIGKEGISVAHSALSHADALLKELEK